MSQTSARISVASRFFAWLIAGYQRFVSPRKGFRCAHRVLHEGESCSQYGKRVVVERGVLASVRLVFGRFRECGRAMQVLQSTGNQGDSKPPKKPSDYYDRLAREEAEKRERLAGEGGGQGCSMQDVMMCNSVVAWGMVFNPFADNAVAADVSVPVSNAEHESAEGRTNRVP